jgi:hypothetical protein
MDEFRMGPFPKGAPSVSVGGTPYIIIADHRRIYIDE